MEPHTDFEIDFRAYEVLQAIVDLVKAQTSLEERVCIRNGTAIPCCYAVSLPMEIGDAVERKLERTLFAQGWRGVQFLRDREIWGPATHCWFVVGHVVNGDRISMVAQHLELQRLTREDRFGRPSADKYEVTTSFDLNDLDRERVLKSLHDMRALGSEHWHPGWGKQVSAEPGKERWTYTFPRKQV